MRARDVFGLIVRTIGLFLLIYAIYCGVYWMAESVLGGGPQRLSTGWYMIYIFVYGLLGYMLVRFADHVVTFSYGPIRRPGQCQNCGYDLRGSPDRCPECGKEPERSVG